VTSKQTLWGGGRQGLTYMPQVVAVGDLAARRAIITYIHDMIQPYAALKHSEFVITPRF
jgi:hypothetical protein